MSTSRRLPEETSRLSANDGTAQIAAALDAASRDPSLAPDVRLLLAQARDALHAASTDAETARLRYHALFDAVPDPVSILDERGIRSAEHTSELQSLMRISYAVFCLKKKNNTKTTVLPQVANKPTSTPNHHHTHAFQALYNLINDDHPS